MHCVDRSAIVYMLSNVVQVALYHSKVALVHALVLVHAMVYLRVHATPGLRQQHGQWFRRSCGIAHLCGHIREQLENN